MPDLAAGSESFHSSRADHAALEVGLEALLASGFIQLVPTRDRGPSVENVGPMTDTH